MRIVSPAAGHFDTFGVGASEATFDYQRGDDSSFRHSPAALGNTVGVEPIPHSEPGSFLRPGAASGSPERAPP